ncbi:hypothetical protein [Nocardia donostiensis]|uniref:Uncharacterized protein n=2 Tax=Nocardia donostiensis TaxID=1538463 RepID=A0A1V2TMH1_9NOCA|nr:hypothetical protein [Nocardia donostiensis]ONM50705.1 hypothetical protein B0T46_02185 [Nocardia donostiensis]OQS18927.1 hypothetical protein B0T44_16940 [Nocardia donostiensis]
MNDRTIARVAVSAAAIGIGAVLTFTAPASAAPTAPGTTQPAAPVHDPAVLAGLDELTTETAHDPAARAGVTALRDYAALVDIAELRATNGVFTPFAYPALTFGCGGNGLITTIFAAGTANGPSSNISYEAPGTLTFHATPSHPGAPLSSGLVVAWLNINNGRSGISALDDMTEYHMPSLSKTVDSGPGTVIASMWGTINYPGAMCVMTPTVGLFGVPEAPVQAPPPAPAPNPEPQPAAPGDNTPGHPAPDGSAPAPATPPAPQPETAPAPPSSAAATTSPAPAGVQVGR